jgi:hypothetical protein
MTRNGSPAAWASIDLMTSQSDGGFQSLSILVSFYQLGRAPATLIIPLIS